MIKQATRERWATEVRDAGHEINDFAEAKVNCTRCGGSGTYSFNLMHGTVCFGCGGRKYSWQPVEQVAKRLRNRAAAAARRETKRANAKAQGLIDGRARLDADPELKAAMAGSKNTFIHSIACRLMLNGTISEKQAASVIKARAGERKYEAAKAESAERATGIPVNLLGKRSRIEGRVTGAKWKTTEWGDSLRVTLTIETPEGGEYRLNGTLPSKVMDALRQETPSLDEGDAIKGRRIAFDAKIERSDQDATFGFWNRPTKAALIALNGGQ